MDAARYVMRRNSREGEDATNGEPSEEFGRGVVGRPGTRERVDDGCLERGAGSISARIDA